MTVECLYFNKQPFRAELEEATGLIRCAIRRKWLSTTPEEKVRQALLIFLQTACPALYPQYIDIRVEHCSLDIALSIKPIWEDFCPDLSPFLIIETKRPEIEPLNIPGNERQLITYLERHDCSNGILTNCRSMWWYQQLSNGKIKKQAMTHLQELVDLIEDAYNQMLAQLTAHRVLFEQAQQGDYASFLSLVTCYGCDASSKITFVYEHNTTPEWVDAFLCSVNNDTIRFKKHYQPRAKTQECTEHDFQRLISIAPAY